MHGAAQLINRSSSRRDLQRRACLQCSSWALATLPGRHSDVRGAGHCATGFQRAHCHLDGRTCAGMVCNRLRRTGRARPNALVESHLCEARRFVGNLAAPSTHSICRWRAQAKASSDHANGARTRSPPCKDALGRALPRGVSHEVGRGRCRYDCNYNLSRLCVSMLIQHKVSRRGTAGGARCRRCSMCPEAFCSAGPCDGASTGHREPCALLRALLSFRIRMYGISIDSAMLYMKTAPRLCYISFTRGRSLCGFLHCAV